MDICRQPRSQPFWWGVALCRPSAVVYDNQAVLYDGNYKSSPPAAWELRLATSDDGNTFTKSSSNPLSANSTPNAYYATDDGIMAIDRPGQGTYYPYRARWTTDLVTFTDYGSYPAMSEGGEGEWDAKCLGHSDVVNVEGQLMIYYAGMDSSDNWQIGRALIIAKAGVGTSSAIDITGTKAKLKGRNRANGRG